MKIKCGNLTFNIQYKDNWNIPENIKKFIIHSNEEVHINYNIEFVDNIETDNRELISTRQDIIVSRDMKNKLESRYIMIPEYQYPYALYKEEKNNIKISILKNFKDQFTLDTMFWSLFALEKHQINLNSIILHCSYVKYKDKAILFSGPSGIGKSTHAELWVKNKNATIINGDRGLLVKEDEWYVDGWPVCGSSKICINERNKIGAIVFLNQGNENKVTLLNKSNAIKRLFSQLTINYWSQDFMDKAISIIEDIVENINIYELICTPDVKAVEVLESMLKENG